MKKGRRVTTLFSATMVLSAVTITLLMDDDEVNAHTVQRPLILPEHLLSTFGLGPRACIGRRFGLTEALTFMSLFLRDWKVDIVLKAGESRQQYMNRVMNSADLYGLAFGLGPTSLRVSKRQAK